MKNWYIILADGETKCDFVIVTPSLKLLILKWPTGQNVKIRINAFKVDYKRAIDGEEITGYAVGAKNRSIGKPIKIVFK